MHWIALLPPHEDEALSWGWHGLRFTPRVARLEEAWLLEIEASERLFGGREGLRAQLLALPPVIPAKAGIQAPAEQGDGPWRSRGTSLLDPRLRGDDGYPPWAEGPTCLVALALLRLKVLGACAPARIPHDLPLPLLSAAVPHAPLLERTGCRTWGQLRALPRGPVVRRFGPGLLQALDIAWGERPARHAWLQLPEVFDQRLELPALAASAPELMAAANRLLIQLQLWLRARHHGVLALALEWTLDLKRHNGVPLPSHEQLVLRTAEPAQETAHLRRLLGEQLARVRLAAPVNHLRLRTLQTCPWQADSRSFLPEDNISGDRLHQLIERLSARLGEDNVLVPSPQADWRPERMQCWAAAQAGTREVTHHAGRTSSLYPPWLLPQPQPLEVRNHQPWYEGPLRLLTRRQRIETGWWEPGGAVVRDYCVARSERAGLLWIFREHRPGGQACWYLQGLYA